MAGSVNLILIAKGVRTLAFGAVSVLTPIYLAMLGYPPQLVGLGIFFIVAGNAVSNILLTWYGNLVGRRRMLVAFSSLMAASGALLFLGGPFPLLAAALAMGNISTTGTEAGPFQSIEVGVLPRLAGARIGRVLGVYNVIGYSASALGALAASLPSYVEDPLMAIRDMYLGYAAVGVILASIYAGMEGLNSSKASAGLSHVSPAARADIGKLSALFAVDAFGGGLVSQSIVSYWFYVRYGASLRELGIIFLAVNSVTAASIIAAPLVAERLGNLKTMVYTHMVSSAFLILIPLASTLPGSLLFLLLRQSTSQMDVPTRQAFMAQIFGDEERVPAMAITNTARSLAALPGAPIAGSAIAVGLLGLPFLLSGSSKIAYDAAIYLSYRERAS
ncbi:MFS transporter [Thermocladium modestius]|uniref:MFS transporter n=1 Tax=Thermocladium modestius TaxID=62609 RepID=A0A830H0J8_9CREN|nr:MFS transporter [Thermocladium modestius]GGP22225.1 MFS transporter [Thermocladium modestius]